MLGSRQQVCERSRGRALRSRLNDGYFRAPRCGFFNRDCRVFRLLRFGLVMRNVPLP